VAGFRPSAGSFKNANPRTAPHSRVRTKKKRPRVGGLSRDMLVRMSSRPPFTPEPQKRDGQILVANRIASEAVVRIVPSNSFDRCNYATSASDRRLHEVFNWCPRSNSRTLTRLGLAGWHFPPPHPCRPVQQSKVDRASGDLGPAAARINPRGKADATAQLHNSEALRSVAQQQVVQRRLGTQDTVSCGPIVTTRSALFCMLVGLLGGSPRRDTARRCT
jgi:hypothetical protein